MSDFQECGEIQRRIVWRRRRKRDGETWLDSASGSIPASRARADTAGHSVRRLKAETPRPHMPRKSLLLGRLDRVQYWISCARPLLPWLVREIWEQHRKSLYRI